MPIVSGPLSLVTGGPATVSGVEVRAPDVRVSGTGAMLTFPIGVSISGGQVTFAAEPGPAVLTVFLGGVPANTIPLLVPAGSSATLAKAMQDAELADGRTLSQMEELLAQVKWSLDQSISRASNEADRAEFYATEVQQTIEGDFATQNYVHAAVEARSNRVLIYTGTGTPTLSNFPDAKIGDIVERRSDGYRWEVQA